jgi:quinol monooxygenase YgiN
MNFVRVGQFSVRPGSADEVCAAYRRDAIPLIRQAIGNIGAMLLRRTDTPDVLMAITLWESREHAEAYEASGQAQRAVDVIRTALAGPPTLTTWSAVLALSSVDG